MADLPHVTWLRAFDAAARHSSFSAAAAELGLTPAAVSQQIRLLEQHLKATLFERLPRGVKLTDLGQAYAVPIRKSFSDMHVATQGLFSPARKRVVQARASISYAALVIAPRLAEFHAANPTISVQLSTSVWADRFGDDGADIDIRYGHGDWDEPDVTHLGHEHAIVVCHPDFAATFGDELSFAAIAGSQVVRTVGFETDWIKMSDHFGLDAPAPPEWCKADSSLIALQTVMAGVGAAIVLESFARPYIDRGLLIAPLAHRLPVQQSHFLIRRDGAGQRGEVLLFCDWISSLSGMQTRPAARPSAQGGAQ